MNDGTRTRGHQGHNLELYQLSYVHHRQGTERYHRRRWRETRARRATRTRRAPRTAQVACADVGVAHVLHELAVGDLEDAVGALGDVRGRG